MSTLQTELDRLYHAHATVRLEQDGNVCALVLELGQPADWSALSVLWRGVQTDLDLPAPAIAVNGVDGHQLWFALAEPVPAAQARQFLEALRVRYLGPVATKRIRLMPGMDTPTAKPVPTLQDSGHWSAYVAPDLAAIFSDEPWLDLPPSPEAQAKVLSGMACIKPGAWAAALDQLKPVAAARTSTGAPAAPVPSANANPSARLFLLGVMNDASAPLPLRIDAAKALLPYGEG